ncbi:stage II sporulation protein M [Effusibacillus consociatus]|uniref:Stage II sporulation protein M n=1 Tax=Effusibacillus consociatus TaxID=1117041 RepID=A0ABV9PVV2_9BACL
MRSISVIKENRGYVWFAFSLFVVGLLIGLVFFEPLHGFLKQYLRHLEQIAAEAKGDHLDLSLLLFKNNLTVSLVLLGSGVFLSILSIHLLVINGMVVGYALALMGQMGQAPVWALILFGILPHGVLEIPAFLIAGAMGIKLGYMWLRPMVGKTRWESFRYAFKEALLALPVIALLLVAAAAIEGFVTPVLLTWYMK